MKFKLLVYMVVLAAFAPWTRAAERGAIKVLLITGGHGFEEQPFFRVFQGNKAIAFTQAAHNKTNATAYERPDLLTYDVVVLYDMPKEITEEQKKRFLSLFDKGIGLVVLHH